MNAFWGAQKTLYFVFAAIFVLFLWSDKATSNSESAYCSGSWERIVIEIESALDLSLRSRNVVLFAGQDGYIFDCLNQDFSQDSIEELQFWEIARSRSISADPFYETNLPPNFCNSSYGDVGSTQVMIIHLPYEREELDEPTCLIRTQGLPKRVKSFLEKE